MDVASCRLTSPPNDEAGYHHRLYEAGLNDVDWLGVVRDSSLVPLLRPMLSNHPVLVPMHYIVVSKECVGEVLAQDGDAFRIAGRCVRQRPRASVSSPSAAARGDRSSA